MVTYIDDKQREDVEEMFEYLLNNCADELRNNDILAIYKALMDSPFGKNPRLSGDRLGKLFENILELYPEMLSTISEIPLGMFYGSGITELNIPASVRKFSPYVFGMSSIRTINYGGTKAEWDALVSRSDNSWDIMTPDGQKVSESIVVNCSDESDIYHVNPEVGESEAEEQENPNTLEESFEPFLHEAMTSKEVIFKRNVLKFLREDGFNSYADYLDKFHFNFVTSADMGQPFVAAISPNTGTVLINPNIDADAISMVLRHEAAHQIFKHFDHLFAKLEKLGIKTPSELAYKLSNMAGDYHISNEIYDDDDKKIAKHLKIENGEEFAGLVTELDFPEHPEYWTMEFDDLWDVLVKHYNITKEQLDAEAQQSQEESEQGPASKESDEYVAGWNALVDAYERGEITEEQLKRWALTQH